MSLHIRHRSTHDELPELDAAARAELRALDAALAGEEIEDAALAAFVRDLQAAAPQMDHEATQALNERVARRFGSPGEAQRTESSRGLRTRLGGLTFSHPRATAAAAFALIAVTSTAGVTVLAGGGSSTQPAPSDSMAQLPELAPKSERPAPGAAAEPILPRPQVDRPGASSSTSSAAAADEDARTTARAVERAVELQVRVKSGGLQAAAGQVSRITRDAGGYVSSSELALRTQGAGTAQFQLRVSSDRLDQAIDRLGGLGTVTRQNESTRDITSTLNSAKARLADATSERRALLSALAKASSAGEIASLRARIAENRRLRASLDRQLQQVQRRADLTTIDLTLRAPRDGDPTGDDGSWSLGDAAADASSAATTVLGAMLIVAAILGPFALLAVIGWVASRRARRRARERTLDA